MSVRMLMVPTIIVVIFLTVSTVSFYWDSSSTAFDRSKMYFHKAAATAGHASLSPSTDSLAEFDALVEHFLAHPKAVPKDPILQQYLKYKKIAQQSPLRDPNHYPTLKELVHHYKKTRGRNPPPLFDVWYDFAVSRSCSDYFSFDRLYKDLEPFWALSPREIRRRVRFLWDNPSTNIMLVRDGKTFSNTGHDSRIQSVEEMMNTFSQYLPDMELPMNIHDEPRIVVPYDTLQKQIEYARGNASLNTPLFSQFPDSLSVEHDPLIFEDTFVERGARPFFDGMEQYCPHDSFLNRVVDSGEDFDSIVHEADQKFFHDRVLTDIDMSKDLCVSGPALRDNHCYLIRPLLRKESNQLLPMFSDTKTSLNNDILIPASTYYRSDADYGYDTWNDISWEKKKDIMFWRGKTTGGYIRPENMDLMLRHRLVYLFNTSLIDKPNHINKMSSPILCQADKNTDTLVDCEVDIRDFLEEHSDVSFDSFDWCNEFCDMMYDIFSLKPHLPPSAQFEHKYLMDVDGNSFSGRFLGFLKSNSLPFKATIFLEWHDSRLVPWVHYIPVDCRLTDLHKLLTYFVGFENVLPSHQGMAQRIALDGRDFAKSALRREDMEIYFFLLMLEYARLLSDNRNDLGFSLD
ncbi:glycosyltransferase family 90 protein [Tortispora caseinolytica NRRL Y-17796]|uniref:Glycosyltransferase family 90 protein n=1 Tax=Tortispora caseinolytica NRRL Y-17796 TaxID=767744 RepID=A0A1E4TFB5_9ASCO|nr:glycosyltransferase family 90 protein [Tortispora caseinolytica NRRL Y-17796]